VRVHRAPGPRILVSGEHESPPRTAHCAKGLPGVAGGTKSPKQPNGALAQFFDDGTERSIPRVVRAIR
jgi:hypothetical protein